MSNCGKSYMVFIVSMILVMIFINIKTSDSFAQQQAKIEFSLSGTAYGLVDSFNPSIYHGDTLPIWKNKDELFDMIVVDSSNAAANNTISELNDDPEFGLFCWLLSNGRSEKIIVEIKTNGIHLVQIKQEVKELGPWGGDQDLYTKNVTKASLQFDRIEYHLWMIWIGFPLFMTDIVVVGNLMLDFNS